MKIRKRRNTGQIAHDLLIELYGQRALLVLPPTGAKSKSPHIRLMKSVVDIEKGGSDAFQTKKKMRQD